NDAPDFSGDQVTDSDSHSVNLFQPAIDVTETGDALSKIGDKVNYTITVYNNSSPDTPTMLFDISDPALAINLQNVQTPNGGTYVTNVTVFLAPAAPRVPYTTLFRFNAAPDFSGNHVADSDSHSVNLFQPAIDVTKTGDALSKIGDTVHYHITVFNN